jgi:superfamily II DNA or RNA helicase
MLKIYIDNVVYSHIQKQDIDKLKECLQYKYQKHNYNPYATKNKSSYSEKIESLIDKNGKFLTGYIPRVKKYLAEKNIQYEIENNSERLKPDNEPIIKGKALREDQKRLVNSAIKNQRGILVSPTGSGKTLLAGSIISCFKDKKTLFLCHTKSLLKQAAADFQEYGLKNITMIGDNEKDLSGDIVIATWQSFIKLDINAISDLFDILIVDECHHLSSKDVSYVQILEKCLSPVRIGLTATFPTKENSKWMIEGLLGEIIGEISLEEGMKLDIVSKPQIKLIKTVCSNDVFDLNRYKDIYDAVITNSKNRNNLIIEEIKKQNNIGNSTLTYVTKIEHGEKLITIAKELKIPLIFIQGKTKGEERELFRNQLHLKTIMNVVATSVWREGVNVKSINCIIIAGGGKSEIALLQSIGRGMRKDIGKDKIIIIDFIDTAKYISEHCCRRLHIYIENEWL